MIENEYVFQVEGLRLSCFSPFDLKNGPVVYTIRIMLDHLQTVRIAQDIINEFENLVTLCLKDKICFSKGRTFHFSDGLPMGAPLSALVADVSMSHQENRVLAYNLAKHFILSYGRYINTRITNFNNSSRYSMVLTALWISRWR